MDCEAVLRSGERLVISRRGPPVGFSAAVDRLPPGEAARLLGWQHQLLEFDPTPLRDIVAEFNRYNRHKLVIADPAIADVTLGGIFSARDYEAFVRLLESSFGVTAERCGNDTVLRKAP